MIPWVTFPIQVDKKRWERFRARVKKDGYRSAKEVFDRFIDSFIDKGLEKPEEKDKS